VEDVAPTESAEAAEPAAEPISVDEILDLHVFLKGYQGTLKELIQQPNTSR
jgi:hypothetical protein